MGDQALHVWLARAVPVADRRSAALSWGSRKQKSIALSTCEAEIIAMSEAAKDVVYLRKFVGGLGAAEADPTDLATDATARKSARDVSYNPEHHGRMKHVARRRSVSCGGKRQGWLL